jgi:hypothetical protein
MEIKSDAWSKFIKDAMDPDSDTSIWHDLKL